MPPRPFPFPLSIGTDICRLARIESLIAKHHPGQPEARDAALDRFLRRLFTPIELNLFWTRFTSKQHLYGKAIFPTAIQHLGGRWAAKEATIKAVYWRSLSLRDVQILHRKPSVTVPQDSFEPGSESSTATRKESIPYVLYLEGSQQKPNDFTSEAWAEARISISHDDGYATAVCMAAEQPEEGDVGGEAAARRHLNPLLDQ